MLSNKEPEALGREASIGRGQPGRVKEKARSLSKKTLPGSQTCRRLGSDTRGPSSVRCSNLSGGSRKVLDARQFECAASSLEAFPLPACQAGNRPLLPHIPKNSSARKSQERPRNGAMPVFKLFRGARSNTQDVRPQAREQVEIVALALIQLRTAARSYRALQAYESAASTGPLLYFGNSG